MIFNVYDAKGKKVSMQKQPVNNGVNDVSIATMALASGNYFIQAADLNTGKTSILKFVKQ